VLRAVIQSRAESLWLRGDDHGGAGEEGLGQVLGERGGYGSGFGEDIQNT